MLGQRRTVGGSATSVWVSILSLPVGTSLTLVTGLTAALVRDSAVP